MSAYEEFPLETVEPPPPAAGALSLSAVSSGGGRLVTVSWPNADVFAWDVRLTYGGVIHRERALRSMAGAPADPPEAISVVVPVLSTTHLVEVDVCPVGRGGAAGEVATASLQL